MQNARKNEGRSALLAATLSLLALPAFAQSPATARGRVVDANSREPLAGVSVELRPGMEMATRWLIQNGPTPLPSFTATTDEAGEFAIPGLQEGRYVVFAELDGYGLRAGPDREIRVAGANAPSYVLEMIRAAAVGGVVEDPDRQGAGGATVQLLQITGLTGARELTSAGSARTGVDGSFEIGGVPEGTYYLMATAARRASAAEAKAGARPAPAGYADTFYLSAAELEDSVPVQVFGGTSASGLRLTMREGKLFDVQGSVSGLPADGARARVTFRRVDRGDPGMLLITPGVVPLQAELDGAGSFRVTGVPEGTYRIRVEGWPGSITQTVDRELDDVALNIPPILRVTGQITGAESAVDALLGRPGAGGSLRGEEPGITSLRVSATGAFELARLTAGTYRISFVPRDGQVVESVKVGERQFPGGRFTLSAAEHVVVELSSTGATIKGRVMGFDDKKTPGAFATLIATPGDRMDGTTLRLIRLDPQGAFVAGGLEPGRYRVCGWTGDRVRATEIQTAPEWRQMLDRTCELVDVKSKATEEIQVDLVPVASLH